MILHWYIGFKFNWAFPEKNSVPHLPVEDIGYPGGRFKKYPRISRGLKKFADIQGESMTQKRDTRGVRIFSGKANSDDFFFYIGTIKHWCCIDIIWCFLYGGWHGCYHSDACR